MQDSTIYVFSYYLAK